MQRHLVSLVLTRQVLGTSQPPCPAHATFMLSCCCLYREHIMRAQSDSDPKHPGGCGPICLQRAGLAAEAGSVAGTTPLGMPGRHARTIPCLLMNTGMRDFEATHPLAVEH